LEHFLPAVGIYFCLLCTLVLVERLYRKFAKENPQLGPFREPDKCMGCKGSEGKCGEDGCDE
jgi:hypothetical protein